VTKEAGDGEPRTHRRDAALRTPELAESMAASLAQRASRSVKTVRLTVTGAPHITPGALFKTDARKGPKALGGDWIACRVRHAIDSRSGFLSTVDAVSAGGSGLLGGLI
jgi:hypothetical protein